MAQLIWACDEIVSELSEQYRLETGDLIYTGTPAAVCPMKPGDSVHALVDDAGTLTFIIGPGRAT